MSRENINTVIASLGLLIGLITAWHQFGPSPDELDIEVTGRVNLSTTFDEIRLFPSFNNSAPKILAGPIFWRTVVYNKLDRPLTIREMETFMLSEHGGIIEYSDMELGFFDMEKNPINFPITIDSRNVKAIIIGLNIPVTKEKPSENPCFKPNSALRDVEVCYFSKGEDLFGNAVDYSEYPNPGGKPVVSASWSDGISSPNFLSVVRTGDNTEFSARFQYYPGM